MTLTLTYDSQLSRVRVAVDGLGEATQVLIERSTDEVRWTTVRGAGALPVTAGAASVDDYEFAADTVNHYRASPSLVEDFEGALVITVTGDWVRTQAEAFTGSWSYTNADIADTGVSDAVVTVPAGATGVAFDWRVSSEAEFDFFEFLIDGVQVLSDSGELPWAHAEFGLAAATTVTLRYTKDDTTSVGDDAAYVDNLVFSGLPVQSAQITPSLGGAVWIKSISRPFLNTPVVAVGAVEVERQARNGVFPIVGRSVPVAVTDVRRSREFQVGVMVDSVAERDRVDLVLASGDPIFLHVPPGSPVPSLYAVIGDSAYDHLMGLFTLPLTECAAPAPELVGATITYQGVLNAYATYADVLAGNATYADVLEEIGDPGEVIVP